MNNFNQTVESLNENNNLNDISKEEAEDRFSRFMTSNILMLDRVINIVVNNLNNLQQVGDINLQQQINHLQNNLDKIKSVIESKHFWKFLIIKNYSNIREAMSKLVITCLKFNLLQSDEIIETLSPMLISCFNLQPLQRSMLDACVLFLQKFSPKCWTFVNVWKQTFPRFFQFLKEANQANINYSIVLPFIAMLSLDIYGQDKALKFTNDLFENIWKGFENVKTNTDKDAIIESFCNCLIYMTLQNEKYVNNVDLNSFLKITKENLLKCCEYYLTHTNTTNYGKYITTVINKLQQKSLQSDNYLKIYLNSFWKELTDKCCQQSNQLNQISLELFLTFLNEEPTQQEKEEDNNEGNVKAFSKQLFNTSLQLGNIGIASSIAFAKPFTVLNEDLFDKYFIQFWRENQQDENVQELLGFFFSIYLNQFEKMEKLLEEEEQKEEEGNNSSLFSFVKALYRDYQPNNEAEDEEEEEKIGKEEKKENIIYSNILEKNLMKRKDLDSIEHLLKCKAFKSMDLLYNLLKNILINKLDKNKGNVDEIQHALDFILTNENTVNLDVLFAMFKGEHFDTLKMLLQPSLQSVSLPLSTEEYSLQEEFNFEEERATPTVNVDRKELFDKIELYIKDLILNDTSLVDKEIYHYCLQFLEISQNVKYIERIIFTKEIWEQLRNDLTKYLTPITIGNEVIWNNKLMNDKLLLDKSVILYSRLIGITLSLINNNIFKDDNQNKNENKEDTQEWKEYKEFWFLREILHSHYLEYLFNNYIKQLIENYLIKIIQNNHQSETIMLSCCDYLVNLHELQLLKIYISKLNQTGHLSNCNINSFIFKEEKEIDLDDLLKDKEKSSTFYEMVDSLFNNDEQLNNMKHYLIDLDKITEWLLRCISLSSSINLLDNNANDNNLEYNINLLKVQSALAMMYCKLSNVEDDTITMDAIIDFTKEFYENLIVNNNQQQQQRESIILIIANLLTNLYETTKIEDDSFILQIITNHMSLSFKEKQFELLDKLIHLSSKLVSIKKEDNESIIKIVENLIEIFLLLTIPKNNLNEEYPIVVERLIQRLSNYLLPLNISKRFFNKIILQNSNELIEIIEHSTLMNAKILATHLLLLSNYHLQKLPSQHHNNHNHVEEEEENKHYHHNNILNLLERMKQNVAYPDILSEHLTIRMKNLIQYTSHYLENENNNLNELPYLLSWYYTLSLLENEKIDSSLQETIFTKLKEHSTNYHFILNLLICFLFGEKEDNEMMIQSKIFKEIINDLIFKFSKMLSLFIRLWFNNCNDNSCVDWIQKLFLEKYSPQIIKDELFRIKNYTKELNVKILFGNQIIAKYEQDEVVLKLTITIPDLYPLKPLQIESNEHSGAIDENKYRKWILKMTTMLFNTVTSNGVVDVLMLWKENLEKHFQGVEPCPICYSVVSGKDHQLPKIECKVCHNRFHGACLYRWFSTSGNQSCPMCRSIGSMSNKGI
ncbi:hypothetical protein ABK040_013313 [Willaertia magna]